MAARKTAPKPTVNSKPKGDQFELDGYYLTYTTDAGESLRMCLDVPVGVMRSIMESDGSEMQQVSAMLAAIGDVEAQITFDSLGWVSEGQHVTARFFEEFARLTGGVSAGE